ncbi:peptidoglycan/LPS O-acetylase OafA/YrhL [Neobacillus niacini]|uniref:acyltransferase family protein n=1 Tax=Neobacillus driksii TaxID=3035913 RepID=UPI002789EAF1|nr:acyltransferase family protein [Neobacillus niacini]MDQ0970740.1 peptidoglycan/LPS O-acetylase OafA/YrhL [Neobacillus niacini]
MMNRQYDLDWIRVLATLAVFIYHCFMFFNPWAWHVKNNETDPTYITAISLFMSAWLMPIFFAVSGINSYYALLKRTGAQYLKERLSRLGIPLLFGVMILTPPQIYMERVSHGQYSGSFFNWYPHYFDGVYLDIGGSGNFAFVGLHLWYLFVLLVFSFITLPMFIR